MRRSENDLEKLWENLRLRDPDYEKYFLVGNGTH